jgi:hypothetical protein
MGVDAPLVLDKGLVAGFVFVYPIADVLAELAVLGIGAVELVGKGTEETVAVPQRRGSIEAELAQLVIKELRVLGGVAEGEELLAREVRIVDCGEEKNRLFRGTTGLCGP